MKPRWHSLMQYNAHCILERTLPTSRTILPLLKRNGKVEDKIFWPQSWVNHISIPCPLVFQSTFPNFAIGSISSVKCWWIPDWGDRLKLEGKGTERLLPIAPASCSKIYKKIVPISHQKIRQNTHKDVKLKSKNCRQYTATGRSSKIIPQLHTVDSRYNDSRYNDNSRYNDIF